MKTIGMFFLLVLFVQPIFAEDLSCPEEEPGKVEALVAGIHKRLKAGTISKVFCKEMNTCMTGNGEYEEYDCSKKYVLEMFLDQGEEGNCNLNLQERYVLDEYMGSLYSCMNRALYSKEGTRFPTLNTSLNASLSRFPKYEGFVFRGSSLPQAVLDQHQVGKTVTYPAYTSTSTSRGTASVFGSHQFLIYSKSGRPIMGLNSGENEVLFTAGTRFRVLAVKDNKYFMREVSGKETEAQAKAEDARIFKLAQEAKSNFDPASKDKPDTWSCPLDDKKIPKRLVQKTIPDIREYVD